MRNYVIIHTVNEDAVRNAGTLEEWIGILADGSAHDVETWDDVFAAMVWEYINAGDYSDFVTENYAGFAALPPGMFA